MTMKISATLHNLYHHHWHNQMHNPISFNLHTLFYTTWRQMQILHKHLCSSVVIQFASNLQLQMCACTYACLTNVKPVWNSWVNKLKSQTGMTNSHNTDLQFQSSSWWFTIPALEWWGIMFLSSQKVEDHTGKLLWLMVWDTSTYWSRSNPKHFSLHQMN